MKILGHGSVGTWLLLALSLPCSNGAVPTSRFDLSSTGEPPLGSVSQHNQTAIQLPRHVGPRATTRSTVTITVTSTRTTDCGCSGTLTSTTSAPTTSTTRTTTTTTTSAPTTSTTRTTTTSASTTSTTRTTTTSAPTTSTTRTTTTSASTISTTQTTQTTTTSAPTTSTTTSATTTSTSPSITSIVETVSQTVIVPTTVTVIREETVTVPVTRTVHATDTVVDYITTTIIYTDIVTITEPAATGTHSTTASPVEETEPVTSSDIPAPGDDEPSSSDGDEVVTVTVTVTVDVPQATTTRPESATLSICPSRIVNPTYTPPTPLPSDYTWGCPPGYLCRPPRSDEGCNFEAGLPADTYVCRPQDCIPSPPLLPPQYWNSPNNPDEPWIFNVSPDYFNLNPYDFGLDYSVFAFPPRDTLRVRAESISIPGECYAPCNDAGLEAQKVGKSELLCRTGSAFNKLLDLCRRCYTSASTKRVVSILPEFQQFLSYCDPAGSVTSSSLPSPTTYTDTSTVTTSHVSTANTTTVKPSTLDYPSEDYTAPTTTITASQVHSTEQSTDTAHSSSAAVSTLETSALTTDAAVRPPKPATMTANTTESSVTLKPTTTADATDMSPYAPLFTGAAVGSAPISRLGWCLVVILLLG